MIDIVENMCFQMQQRSNKFVCVYFMKCSINYFLNGVLSSDLNASIKSISFLIVNIIVYFGAKFEKQTQHFNPLLPAMITLW